MVMRRNKLGALEPARPLTFLSVDMLLVHLLLTWSCLGSTCCLIECLLFIIPYQVFCFIVLVAAAILYFAVLWTRQIFSGPPTDKNSLMKAPPRVLLGQAALPVYGHTFLFQRLAGDMAGLFSSEWRENGWFGGRSLGDMFAVYIWGQWRVAIKGPDRCRRVMEEGGLTASFPWTAPTALLGMSCLPFMKHDDAEQLRILLSRPLAHKSILQYAPAFARAAEKCLDDLCRGLFTTRASYTNKNLDPALGKDEYSNTKVEGKTTAVPAGAHAVDDESDSPAPTMLKLKWNALRSYTLDLVDGPVLNLNMWETVSQQSGGQSTREDPSSGDAPPPIHSEKLPSRNAMLLWMDRVKAGIDVIKMTFGPEWMYIWLLNEYGRAINARQHISSLFSKHAKDMSAKVPVEHREGHSYNDPTTQPIPLRTLRDNFKREKEGIFGLHGTHRFHTPEQSVRARAYSAPEVNPSAAQIEPGSVDGALDYVVPFATEQDLARPRYELSPLLHRKKDRPKGAPQTSPSRRNFHQEPFRILSTLTQSAAADQMSILEQVLRQQDLDGNGVSQAVTTELMIVLWMMLDAGNVWCAMAMHLLSVDQDACDLVQEELDKLEEKYGYDCLFTPAVLQKMAFMDALVFEAIRLSPPFLGGLKMTTETIEFSDEQLQLGKGSCVFFCQPTDVKFNLRQSVGRRPEELGKRYPSVNLYGFLPLNGLEVPLMVLQNKVFLISMLRKYTPYSSKRRSVIRRVSVAVRQKIQGSSMKGFGDSQQQSTTVEVKFASSPILRDVEHGSRTSLGELNPCEAMSMFTKIPFPEPLRVTYLRKRA